MKSNTIPEFPSFDIVAKAQELIDHKAVQEILARPGTRERIITFLQTGSVSSLADEDRALVQMLVSLISTYALQTAYEKCKSDEAVRQYISFIDRMHGGEDLEQEMIALVPKLPAEFKDAVRAGSSHAQNVIIGLLKMQ